MILEVNARRSSEGVGSTRATLAYLSIEGLIVPILLQSASTKKAKNHEN